MNIKIKEGQVYFNRLKEVLKIKQVVTLNSEPRFVIFIEKSGESWDHYQSFENNVKNGRYTLLKEEVSDIIDLLHF